jgi:RNA polymerase sigma-70 factor (ECF subfamily)
MDELDDPELLRRLREGTRPAREAAFAALHRRHSRRSFQLAWRVLGDADLAADAVQEAFLTVWRKGARFEERAQFSSWLYRVVLNRSIDLRRKEQRAERARGSADRPAKGGPTKERRQAGAGAAGSQTGTRPGKSPAAPAPASSPGGNRAAGTGARPSRAAGAAGEEAPDPLAQVADRAAGPEEVARTAERDEALWRAVRRLSPKLEEVVVLRYSAGLSYEEIGQLLSLPRGTVRSRLNRAHAALRELLGEGLEADEPDFP